MLAIVILALLASAPVANAHSMLISSSPAKDSSIAAGPTQVVLEFNEALDHGFTELVVLGPDGASHWEGGPAEIADTKISAPLRTLGPAGAYTIAYRVTSADGHPVSGTVKFTLTTAGGGLAAAPAVNTQPGVAPPSTADTSMPVWPWLAGAVALLVAGIAVSVRIGRMPAGKDR
jgi:hypothetical protein